jgi:predicted nucleic acid-binding protein
LDEVRNSVLMGLRRSRISKADAEGFLASLADLNIQLADPVSYDAVFKLAEFNGLTVYDAAYLDLAIRDGSQLASLDDALQKAAVRAGSILFELPKSV